MKFNEFKKLELSQPEISMINGGWLQILAAIVTIVASGAYIYDEIKDGVNRPCP